MAHNLKVSRAAVKEPAGAARLTLADLRLLVDSVRDYAIFMLDPDGHVVSWNAGAERIKGYSEHEAIGKHMSAFYLPEQASGGVPAHLLNRARAEGSVENEGWRVRKDGSRFWADVVITALHDDTGELRGFAKVTRDLTERRNTELLLSDLSGRLLRLQDDERRRIARDLHDTTSPLLTSLTGKLYAARQRARAVDDMLSSMTDEALSLAEATATMVRTTASMLHPPLLDQAGLLPALKWYIDSFSHRTGLAITSQLPDSMPRIDHSLEVVVFRTAQEWLSEVMSAGTRNVGLKLSKKRDVQLEIDAIGLPYDTVSAIGSDLNVTMTALKSRLRQVGGDLRAEASASGTLLIASVPTQTPNEFEGGLRAI